MGMFSAKRNPSRQVSRRCMDRAVARASAVRTDLFVTLTRIPHENALAWAQRVPGWTRKRRDQSAIDNTAPVVWDAARCRCRATAGTCLDAQPTRPTTRHSFRPSPFAALGGPVATSRYEHRGRVAQSQAFNVLVYAMRG